ncbi:MAG: ABC transporter ATP-binding protein [Nitrososphaerota archaeon]
MLKVTNLTKRFGGIKAVDNCSFEVKEKRIFGLIGPNGSGKSTILNIIMAFEKPDSGNIYFKNECINGLKTHQIVRKGIAMLFQNTRIFKRISVIENLKIPLIYTQEKEKIQERAIELLKFFDLYHLKDEYAGNLSYGQQRMLEFALVLMGNPDLILLDEPVGGLNPVMVKRVNDIIKELRNDYGKTFLIVEHNIPFVMGICEKIMVLDAGKKIAEGSPEEIRYNERVIEAYLGKVEV